MVTGRARLCRQVKLAKADVVSAGGLTMCMTYHLIPKQESVVQLCGRNALRCELLTVPVCC